MSNFRPIGRQTAYLLPPSVKDWLPEEHLARFVVDVFEQLDLSAMSKAYRGSGRPATILVCWLGRPAGRIVERAVRRRAARAAKSNAG